MTDVINVGQMANDEGSGANGWSPLFAVVEDSARRVLQLADWTGGTGTMPAGTGKYLGPDGLVEAIADATDIRGAAGSGGEGGSVAWADITGKPATFAPIIGSGSDQAVAGNDSRLTDARSPTAHTHAVSDVTGLQTLLDAKATPDDIDSRISALVDGAPEALDTLKEIADQLEEDESVVGGLITSIAAKAPLASPAFTGTVTGITKAMVGLPLADNTSDASKPVSTAMQTALDLKVNTEDLPRYEVLSELPADFSGYPDGSRIIIADE